MAIEALLKVLPRSSGTWAMTVPGTGSQATLRVSAKSIVAYSRSAGSGISIHCPGVRQT